MANNYLLFSTEITELSDEELAWARQRLSELEKSEDWVEDGLSFMYKVSEKESELNEDDYVWLYSDENDSAEAAAAFIQEFIKKFRPKMKFVFSWAYTCSKPRVDEFGGGAVGITADRMEWVYPDLVAQRLISIEEEEEEEEG